MGVNDTIIGTLREAWLNRTAVDEFVHGKIMELFRLYLVVGGMPAAVSKYLDNNNLQEVMAVQQDIVRLYKRDIGLLASQYAEGLQMRIIKGDKNINFGSIYENAVAQELVAHGITPYYYNNKKRGELDFVIELNGKALPIEVKSGKDYETHRALANIMDCDEYGLTEAVVFNNDNLRVAGNIVYAPIYMAMFLEKNNAAPAFYKVDISGLESGFGGTT